MKSELIVCVFGFVLTIQGCALESNIQRFGSGGVFSVKSKGKTVYDFSKDGKYLWLSETECYDLTGSLVDISALDEVSYPLPRMKWKRRILGADMEYSISRNRKKIDAQAVSWWTTNHLADRQKVDYVSSELTFPAMLVPVVTVQLCSYKPFSSNVAIGVCPDGGESEMLFRSVNITHKQRDMPSVFQFVVSESTNRASACVSRELSRSFFDVRFDFEDGHLEVSNVVVVTENEIVRLLGDEKVYGQHFSGCMFLDDNYFAFPVRRGGCRSLISRDYLLVYGFREKRIVKAFKSRYMLFDQNDTITDIDIVLSADEKHLAIRYDGVITVYQFDVTGSDCLILSDVGMRPKGALEEQPTLVE